MPYGIIFMNEVLPSLILVAGGVLAMWIGSNTWLKLKKPAGSADFDRIAESLEMLHNSVEDLRDELRGQMTDVRELSGRIEFAERMLTKARDDGRV
jgi:hypothetical protein